MFAERKCCQFSHTNRKHFTVGDLMAFPIVKIWRTKTSKNLPFPLHDVDPHVIQQCIGLSHAPPHTAAPMVEALSNTDAVNSPLVTLARPKFAPKSSPSCGPIPKPHYPLPHPWTVRPMMPNGIRIRSDPIPFFREFYWIVQHICTRRRRSLVCF